MAYCLAEQGIEGEPEMLRIWCAGLNGTYGRVLG